MSRLARKDFEVRATFDIVCHRADGFTTTEHRTALLAVETLADIWELRLLEIIEADVRRFIEQHRGQVDAQRLADLGFTVETDREPIPEHRPRWWKWW